jgi:hypothetical protein
VADPQTHTPYTTMVMGIASANAAEQTSKIKKKE